MPRCIRCGEYFKAPTDSQIKICPACEEFKSDRYQVCNVCEEIFDASKVINGLCPSCRSDNSLDDEVELEEELEDEIYDS